MLRLLAAFTLLALAGCGPTTAELAAQDTAKCENYGFTPGSQGFASCRMHLDQHRQQMLLDALDSMTPQRVSTTCTSFGATTSCY